jgi:hypothetical protein
MYEQTLRYTAAFVEGREVVWAPEPWTYSEFTIIEHTMKILPEDIRLKMMAVEQ